MPNKSPSSESVLRDAPDGVRAAKWGDLCAPLQNELIAAVKQKRWPILLVGEPGRGKTFAMTAFYRRWPSIVDKQKCPLWIECESWLRMVMECRKTGSVLRECANPGVYPSSYTSTEKDLLREAKRVDLLCIDDAGISTDSESKRSAFLDLVNCREDKPTVITTNIDTGDLYTIFDHRIASRMMDGTVIRLVGKDKRLEGTKIIEITT